MQINSNIENFFNDFPYQVFHENDVLDVNVEHFFVIIDKSDILDKFLSKILEDYQNTFSLKSLSNNTLQFFKDNSNNFYIFIKSLNKKDFFYEQNKAFIEKNVSNLLSNNIFGVSFNTQSSLINNVENNVDKIKKIGKITKNLIIKKINN